MKNFRFSWRPLFALVGFAGLYVLSCQRDAEQTAPKPLSDFPVGSRSCDNPNYCTCTVTTDADATLDLCGDLPQATTSCTGCTSGSLGASGAMFLANEPKQFCVEQSGSLCITNAGSSSVDVTVRFGSSTPITITIGASQTQCFHTVNCGTTENHCQ